MRCSRPREDWDWDDFFAILTGLQTNSAEEFFAYMHRIIAATICKEFRHQNKRAERFNLVDLGQDAWVRVLHHCRCHLSGATEDEMVAWLNEKKALGSFQGWLSVVAKNVTRSHFRKKSKRPLPAILPMNLVSPVSNPYQRAVENEELAIVDGFLDMKAKESERQVLLRKLEGESHKEIAANCEIDEGTTRNHLRNIRREMRVPTERKKPKPRAIERQLRKAKTKTSHRKAKISEGESE